MALAHGLGADRAHQVLHHVRVVGVVHVGLVGPFAGVELIVTVDWHLGAPGAFTLSEPTEKITADRADRGGRLPLAGRGGGHGGDHDEPAGHLLVAAVRPQADLGLVPPVALQPIGADPQGGGEPAIIVVGAAVANAIFDAVGARVLRMPMTADRVKAAMPKA